MKEEIENKKSMKEETKEVTDKDVREESGSRGPLPTRSLILWVLAGIYLLYTGYSICKNVIEGKEGSGIGFLIAGIGFLIVGGALLFLGAKGMLKADRIQKAEEAAKAKMEAEKARAEAHSSRSSMSISQRANLAGRMNEEADKEENPEEFKENIEE